MLVVQCSLRYSTTSAFCTGLTEGFFGRTPLFADYGVLPLSSLEKQEGFPPFFFFGNIYDDYDEKGLCAETRIVSFVTAQQTPSF